VFTLELSAKQVQARRGYIVVWEAMGKVSRIAFQLKKPVNTADETILKAISLQKFGEKLFRGFEGRAVRIEFTNLGTLTKIIAIDSGK
jgi:hypothetical protein